MGLHFLYKAWSLNYSVVGMGAPSACATSVDKARRGGRSHDKQQQTTSNTVPNNVTSNRQKQYNEHIQQSLSHTHALTYNQS